MDLRGDRTQPAQPADPPLEIGALASLRIVCISELGWRDSATLLADIGAAGGMGASQYGIPWPPLGDLHPGNAAGVSALLEATAADGRLHRVLLDAGWSPDWMRRRLAEEGVDRLLARREVECLVITHEHYDHFWGIGAVLEHCPELPVYVPDGFHAEGLDLIRRQGHTGPVTVVPAQRPLALFPGCAVVQFPVRTLLQAEGENVLYFGVAGRGLAMVTGCGHAGVLDLLAYARREFAGGERVHAVYGGLHIAPFDDWSAEKDAVIATLAGLGIDRVACNHCTGAVAVRKMLDAGMRVVRGSARNGSATDLYLGNGDVLELAGE